MHDVYARIKLVFVGNVPKHNSITITYRTPQTGAQIIDISRNYTNSVDVYKLIADSHIT